MEETRKQKKLKPMHFCVSVSGLHLHVRLSGNVVLKILHWTDQEGNVTRQHLKEQDQRLNKLIHTTSQQRSFWVILRLSKLPEPGSGRTRWLQWWSSSSTRCPQLQANRGSRSAAWTRPTEVNRMCVFVFTGEFLKECSHVVRFVEACPHLGQHFHVFHHQFLHTRKLITIRKINPSTHFWISTRTSFFQVLTSIYVFKSSHLLLNIWK